MTTAGYNRRHRMKNRWPGARVFVCTVCMAMLLAITPVCKAARTGMRRPRIWLCQIAALTGPGAVSLTIRNNSSISVDEIPAIRRLLLNGLSALGV